MTAEEYNERVRAAARNQRLGGTVRDFGTARDWHHWLTTAERESDILWRINVGPGTVNDRMAAIPYLREHDPRGWFMPADHPQIGANDLVVDRQLTELADPPFLLATVPASEGNDQTALADFRRVADAERRPLLYFRSREMWERDLYFASVFLTATPGTYSRVENQYHFPLPAQPNRFRVAIGPRLPTVPRGNSYGGVFELARLYLTRANGDPATDRLYVQQRCFWSLWTLNVSPNPGGAQSIFTPTPVFGGIGLGFADAFAEGAAAVANELVDEILAAIARLYEGTSGQPFWSAA